VSLRIRDKPSVTDGHAIAFIKNGQEIDVEDNQLQNNFFVLCDGKGFVMCADEDISWIEIASTTAVLTPSETGSNQLSYEKKNDDSNDAGAVEEQKKESRNVATQKENAAEEQGAVVAEVNDGEKTQDDEQNESGVFEEVGAETTEVDEAGAAGDDVMIEEDVVVEETLAEETDYVEDDTNNVQEVEVRDEADEQVSGEEILLEGTEEETAQQNDDVGDDAYVIEEEENAVEKINEEEAEKSDNTNQDQNSSVISDAVIDAIVEPLVVPTTSLAGRWRLRVDGSDSAVKINDAPAASIIEDSTGDEEWIEIRQRFSYSIEDVLFTTQIKG
jgi:hypothetical protein